MRASLSRYVFFVCLLFAGNIFAAPLIPSSVNFEDGTLYTTSGIATYDVSGAMMAGMEVTATFSNGDVETSIWGATNPLDGAAIGLDWGVRQRSREIR